MRIITIYGEENNIQTIMSVNLGIAHMKGVNQGREDMQNLDKF